MENANQAIRKQTQTKYEVTSCYFCSEFLDNIDFKSHLEKCGQALQKCPNDCLAYVQRKFMEQHLSECPKKEIENSSACSTSCIESDEYFMLEQNVTLLRSSLHEEIRQRHRLISDLGVLRKSYAEDAEKRFLESETFKAEITNLSRQYKDVKEWRRELRVLLDKFHQDLEFRNEATLSFEVLFCEKDRMTTALASLESEIEKLKSNRDKISNTVTPINDNSLDSGSGSIVSVGSSQPTRCQRCPFLEWKLSESLVELRQMKNTVYETEVKCESSARIVHDTQKMCAQTKQELVDLQVHLAAQQKMTTIADSKGHLIWRIDNYTEKLKNAKENQIVLKSPIFCNKRYGYTLRLEVLLNGIGTWKGRNVLACLNVISGEWDALLPWPCKLKADIILRNQSYDSPQNISKTITVKKHDEHSYEQSQYIFISHKTIQNEQFSRNDCIFFEVIVHKSRNS